MSDGWLLFVTLSLIAITVFLLASTFIRARIKRHEEESRQEISETVDEDRLRCPVPVRAHAKGNVDHWLWGLSGGGVVFLAVLSWTGLGLLAAFGGLIIYLLIAAPIALWRVRAG